MEPVFPVPLDLEDPPGGRVHALQAQLRQAIVAGRLAAGMRLPSTRRAAAALGIGRNTVIAAYADYAQDTAVRPGLVFGFGCIDAGEAVERMEAFAKALAGRANSR